MNKRAIITIFFIGSTLATTLVMATPAEFEIKATFKRNPKIWGTYKLSDERVTIKRGKRKWKKRPPPRIGDMIISDGNLVFLRETQNNDQTTIVVDKIPYKKKGNSNFRGMLEKEEHQEILAKLFERDLKELIPHRDLLKGEIDYKSVDCIKSRGQLECHLKGQMNPPNNP